MPTTVSQHFQAISHIWSAYFRKEMSGRTRDLLLAMFRHNLRRI